MSTARTELPNVDERIPLRRERRREHETVEPEPSLSPGVTPEETTPRRWGGWAMGILVSVLILSVAAIAWVAFA